MMPYSWLPKRDTDNPFARRIAEAVGQSRPVVLPNIMGLFERQTLKQKRASGYKAAASKMGLQFAKRLQFRKGTI